MVHGAANNPGALGVMNSTPTTSAPSAGGNLLSNQKDAKEASTDAKFGEVWKQIQAKYGAKPEKPREIKKTLGKDDFLRIMITQMKNQDPTSPFKAEQFATQMAQFTSVEQLQNLNQAMNKMANQNKPLERMAMTNLIGKKITVDRERFPHTEGQNDSLNYVLPKDAKKVRIDIVSENGETMLTKELGEQKAGENTFSWDGVKGNTLPAKTGNYMFRVTAQDERGMSLPTNPKSQAQVVGVSFEGAEPVLLIGNPNAPDKVLLRNIVKIEGDEAVVPGAQSLAKTAAAQLPGASAGTASVAKSMPNFIAFKKGEGSSTVDPGQLSPDTAAALQKYAAQQAEERKQELQQAQRPAIYADGEKGFPNGLSDSGENDAKIGKGGNSQ
jgi:flagellar basal-body rod modification protein FlgD